MRVASVCAFYEFLQVKVLWEVNKGVVMILISISLEIINLHSVFCCSPSLSAWFGPITFGVCVTPMRPNMLLLHTYVASLF